jgi:drug/metabolite transporter (DMT)-like permease
MSDNRPPVMIDWLVLALLAVVWGASFIFIKRSVAVLEPAHMAFWRMALATLIYLPIALSLWSRIDWSRWPAFIGVAFFGSAIPNYLFAIAQQHVSSSLAGVLNALTPMFTLLLGWIVFRKAPGLSKLWGVLLGLLGASVLIWNSSGGQATKSNALYAALCVLATACYAANAVLVTRYLRDQHPAAIASAAFMITGVFFISGLFASGAWSAAMAHPDGLTAIGYVGYLAALGTVGGSILYFWLLQRTGAVFATSVTYLLPVTAMLIGMLDGETITGYDMMGTAIILTGIYLIRTANAERVAEAST